MSDTIQPHALATALDRYSGLTVLSLDCFDTLIWRDTHSPADIFGGLGGATPLQRIRAETQARKLARHGRNRNEVMIAEIYAALLPGADAAERDAAVAAELATEARHCYAFAPTVALMREAKARGMQVVIVSDTYLETGQLRDLIALSAGEDVAGLIDRIFCSAPHGLSKAEGLYREVLRKLKARPKEILHIGDNPIADVAGVEPFGVNVLHLRQFDPRTEQRLRQESAIDALFHPHRDPHYEGAVRALQPHRAGLAIAEPQCADDATRLGLSALGPVFHGFERWLQAEAESLRAASGGTVHWLFLMRDGYLPMLVHRESGHPAIAHGVEISRFTATAAHFENDRDVQRYCEAELGTNPSTLARQMLFPEDAVARIAAAADPSAASLSLLAEVRAGPRRKKVVRASRAMAERLVAHVRKTVDPKPGDTLMLVDLGYNGTVQNRIDALLRKALGVRVAGRYLLLREMDRSGLDKKGFIGIEHYDEHALESLCGNVAVIEQLCTTEMGSVIDYEPDGTPIRKASDIKGRQSAVRDRIQAGCLRFVREQPQAIVRAAVRAAEPDATGMWRRAAAAALGRLMFLPLDPELAVMERFEHDVNLGTGRTVALFDREVAGRGMRRRGLFYMKGAQRMYLPAELAGHGLAAKLTLLANKRFGLPFSFADFADAGVTLPVIYADNDEVLAREVTAVPTHDGYYLATIPVGDCRYSVAVRFGSLYEWVQVESPGFLPADALMAEREEDLALEIPAAPLLDGIAQVSPGLYRCDSETGFMMIHPPQAPDEPGPMVLTVVFRPLADRARPEAAHRSTLASLTEAH